MVKQMEVTDINECPIGAHEQRFQNIETDVGELKGNVSELADKVNSIDKTVAVKNNEFEKAIASLSTLPDILTELQFSNKSIRKDVDHMESQVDSIDSEGKFNIRVWLRDNFISAVLAIGGVIAMFAYFQK